MLFVLIGGGRYVLLVYRGGGPLRQQVEHWSMEHPANYFSCSNFFLFAELDFSYSHFDFLHVHHRLVVRAGDPTVLFVLIVICELLLCMIFCITHVFFFVVLTNDFF